MYERQVCLSGERAILGARQAAHLVAVESYHGQLTGNCDHRRGDITRSLIDGTQAIGHEAETALTKETHQHKSVLLLPDFGHAKTAVLNRLISLDAQRAYRHADEFVDWYCSEFAWLSTE